MPKRYNFNILVREDWSEQERPFLDGATVCFTDGLKTEDGSGAVHSAQLGC